MEQKTKIHCCVIYLLGKNKNDSDEYCFIKYTMQKKSKKKQKNKKKEAKKKTKTKKRSKKKQNA
jgi:hypothetical protein